jgi:hypothetical protein
LQDLPKFTQIWFENKPSGNPDVEYAVRAIIRLLPFTEILSILGAIQGCRMVYSENKIPNVGKFWIVLK